MSCYKRKLTWVTNYTSPVSPLSASAPHPILKAESSVSLPFSDSSPYKLALTFSSSYSCVTQVLLHTLSCRSTHLLAVWQLTKKKECQDASSLVRTGMTCSWSLLLCILVSSSKFEMSDAPTFLWLAVLCCFPSSLDFFGIFIHTMCSIPHKTLLPYDNQY